MFTFRDVYSATSWNVEQWIYYVWRSTTCVSVALQNVGLFLTSQPTRRETSNHFIDVSTTFEYTYIAKSRITNLLSLTFRDVSLCVAECWTFYDISTLTSQKVKMFYCCFDFPQCSRTPTPWKVYHLNLIFGFFATCFRYTSRKVQKINYIFTFLQRVKDSCHEKSQMKRDVSTFCDVSEK